MEEPEKPVGERRRLPGQPAHDALRQRPRPSRLKLGELGRCQGVHARAPMAAPWVQGDTRTGARGQRRAKRPARGPPVARRQRLPQPQGQRLRADRGRCGRGRDRVP